MPPTDPSGNVAVAVSMTILDDPGPALPALLEEPPSETEYRVGRAGQRARERPPRRDRVDDRLGVAGDAVEAMQVNRARDGKTVVGPAEAPRPAQVAAHGDGTRGSPERAQDRRRRGPGRGPAAIGSRGG